MNLEEIISDSLRYPLRDWKKILSLGIIILFTNIAGIDAIKVVLSSINVQTIYLLAILGFIINFFWYGYLFRIMKSSLTDVIELPKFNNWVEMFKDGLKVAIVALVYALPSIFIMVVYVAQNLNFALGIIGSDPTMIKSDLILGSGIWGLIAILYYILILPIVSMAIVHMANNSSKLAAAFRFKEILNKISLITWSKLITWFITTIIILSIGIVITVMILLQISISIERFLLYLVLFPYLYMYIHRSAALIYNSNENNEDKG